MVPYYVMKNPSEPSLIGSATSCMLLGPISFSKIQPSIQRLKIIKVIAFISEPKAIRFEVDVDTNIANKSRATGVVSINAPLMGR